MSVRREKNKKSKLPGPWIVDIEMELPNGKKIRKRKVSPLQTKRGALDYEKALRESLLLGEHKSLDSCPKTFREFSITYMSDHVSAGNKPSELAAKRSILRLHLVPYFGEVLVRDLDEVAINRFIKRQIEIGFKPKTVNNQLILVRTLLGCAFELGLIAKLPKVKKLRVVSEKVEFLDETEKARLVKSSMESSEWSAAIAVALNCGLRLGELIALKWEDIDLVSQRLWVQRSDWQGTVDIPKSGKARVIPLNAEVTAALKLNRSLKGEWVFSRTDGSRMNKDEFASALERIRKRAGLRKFGWHMLRHTFASHLACQGTPMHVIKDLLGHSSLAMTMRYAHLGEDDSRKAVDALERGWRSNGSIAAETKMQPFREETSCILKS